MAKAWDARKLKASFRQGAVAALNQSMVAYQNAIVTTLSRRGTGRIYRIAKGRKTGRNLREKGFHQASSPGRPPAVNTGTLRRSWQVGGPYNVIVRHGLRSRDPSIRLGTRVRYARFLQYGTSRMAARPYVDVARRKVNFPKIVAFHINRAVQRGVA